MGFMKKIVLMLMMNKKGDGADFRKEEDKDREIKAELRRLSAFWMKTGS